MFYFLGFTLYSKMKYDLILMQQITMKLRYISRNMIKSYHRNAFQIISPVDFPHKNVSTAEIWCLIFVILDQHLRSGDAGRHDANVASL